MGVPGENRTQGQTSGRRVGEAQGEVLGGGVGIGRRRRAASVPTLGGGRRSSPVAGQRPQPVRAG